MQELLSGYQRFREQTLEPQRSRWHALGEGQYPRTMVIGCCDSRVDPATIFDQPPGELFVVRNVANLVPPCEPDGTYHGTSSALEFAVTALKIREIVVLGHASCGGVEAARKGAAPEGSFVGRWVGLLDEARARLDEAGWPEDDAEAQLALELMGIRVSLDRLRTFPFVASRLEAGNLALRGAHFGIADGALRVMGEDGTFSLVNGAPER